MRQQFTKIFVFICGIKIGILANWVLLGFLLRLTRLIRPVVLAAFVSLCLGPLEGQLLGHSPTHNYEVLRPGYAGLDRAEILKKSILF